MAYPGIRRRGPPISHSPASSPTAGINPSAPQGAPASRPTQLPEMGYFDYRVIAFFEERGIDLSEPAGVLWTDTEWRLLEDFDDTFHRTWQVQSTM